MDLSTVNGEAVVGYYLQDYSYAEMADLLGVPVSTVKSRLFKGRQQLRQRLEHLRQPSPFRPEQTQEEFSMTPELIPIQIEMICEYILAQRSILFLRTLEGETYLPIKLLPEEAVVIERALKSQPDALPVTHQDTLMQIVARLGGRMEKVIPRSLANQNYYASLVITQDGQQYEVDCRLSEALALAVRAQIPILSAPMLWEESGIALETLDTDPAVAEGELPDPVDPVTVSDQWRDTFVEQVWSFLLSVLYGSRNPRDLSRLRNTAWEELFSARAANWENQTMQVVQLPVAEPAWLVLRPERWSQISDFVEWAQQRNIEPPPQPQPLFIALNGDQQKQVEKILEGAWSAVRMGRAAVKDLVLTRHSSALINAVLEPGIRITYERSPAFNPAQAAGPHVTSTSELLIHNVWLLVIGWASDQLHREEQKQLERVRGSLEVLLQG
jgi:bifunctional DNase/RNase